MKYGGFEIKFDGEACGFYWCNGCRMEGYFDTVDEVKASIDDYNADALANDPSWPPADTPSLAAPWWESR
jgi:hypothetical protein